MKTTLPKDKYLKNEIKRNMRKWFVTSEKSFFLYPFVVSKDTDVIPATQGTSKGQYENDVTWKWCDLG